MEITKINGFYPVKLLTVLLFQFILYEFMSIIELEISFVNVFVLATFVNTVFCSFYEPSQNFDIASFVASMIIEIATTLQLYLMAKTIF